MGTKFKMSQSIEKQQKTFQRVRRYDFKPEICFNVGYVAEAVQFYKVDSEFTVVTETGLHSLAMDAIDKHCVDGDNQSGNKADRGYRGGAREGKGGKKDKKVKAAADLDDENEEE